jgi:hypothetical protein
MLASFQEREYIPILPGHLQWDATSIYWAEVSYIRKSVN